MLRLTLCAVLCAANVSLCSAASPLEQPMPPEQFAQCVQALADQVAASSKPLARDDFTRIASTAKYDDRVRRSMLVQTTEPTFIWDELAATTDDQRVTEGRAVLSRDPQTLQKIEARFGV